MSIHRRTSQNVDTNLILPDATILEMVVYNHLLDQDSNAVNLAFRGGIVPQLYQQVLFIFSYLVYKYSDMFGDTCYNDGAPLFFVSTEVITSGRDKRASGVRIRLVLQYHEWVKALEEKRNQASADDDEKKKKKPKPGQLTLVSCHPGHLLHTLTKENRRKLTGLKAMVNRQKLSDTTQAWRFAQQLQPIAYTVIARVVSGGNGGGGGGGGGGFWWDEHHPCNPLNVWSVERSMRAVCALTERCPDIDAKFFDIDEYREDAGDGYVFYKYPFPMNTHRVMPAALIPGRLHEFELPHKQTVVQITPKDRSTFMGLINAKDLTPEQVEEKVRDLAEMAVEVNWWSNVGVGGGGSTGSTLDALRTHTAAGSIAIGKMSSTNPTAVSRALYEERLRNLSSFGCIWTPRGNMPVSLQSIAGWGESHLASHSNFCLPRLPCASNLSPLANLVLQDHVDLKFATSIGTLSRQASLLLYSSLHVYNLASKLNVNFLWFGTAAQGKSFVLTRLFVILIKGTVTCVTHMTQKAEMADGAEPHIDVQIIIQDDVCPSALGIGATPGSLKGNNGGGGQHDAVTMCVVG
jgi:hypothetical protein